MSKILATASVLALMAGVPAWAANPAAAPNGSVPYQPKQAAANSAPNDNAQTNTSSSNTTAGAANNAAENPSGTAASNSAATASNQSAAPTGANESANDQDRTFVKQALSAGMMEIEQGQFAIDRASDLAVREFGRWMITDHGQLGVLLKAAAKSAGIDVQPALSSQDQDMVNKLKELNGVAFEKQYVTDAVSAHEQAVHVFQAEVKCGQNTGLRGLGAVGLAMVKQHLTEAQELQSAMPQIVAATTGKK